MKKQATNIIKYTAGTSDHHIQILGMISSF